MCDDSQAFCFTANIKWFPTPVLARFSNNDMRPPVEKWQVNQFGDSEL